MITSSQIRAANGLLNWSFETLAQKSGVSRPTLVNIVNGKSVPHKETMRKIFKAFESHGVEFIEGGARIAQDIVKVYEGPDCYLRFLDDAFIALAPTQGTILFSGADERRSPKTVIEKLRAMRGTGIKMKSLVKDGDTYLMGTLDEYRWLPKDLFVDGDVKIIYGDIVAYLMSWLGTPRVVVIKDEMIAQENTRIFNYLWERSITPTHTTSPTLYEDA